MRVRVFALSAIALVLLAGLLPGALADDFSTRGSREFDLRPTDAFPASTTINLANATVDGSNGNLEKDALDPIMLEAGRYFGPYVRSSLFEFTYSTGGNFSFTSTFNFSRDEIASGVASFWVRWPIVPSDYRYFCWYVYGAASALAWPFFASGSTRTYARCVAEDPSNLPAYLIANFVPGVVGVDTLPGLYSKKTTSGFYYKEFIGLLPGIEYHYLFVGALKENVAPKIWVSIEKYQDEATTNFSWSNDVTSARRNESLPIYPAFAFNFVSGIGEGGLTSYKFEFDNSSSNFLFYENLLFPGSTAVGSCDDHISIYVPFAHANGATFVLNVTLWPYAYPTGTGFNEWVVLAKRGFLLTSTPDSIGTIMGTAVLATCRNFSINIWVRTDRPVTLLGYVPTHRSTTTTWRWGDQWWKVFFTEGLSGIHATWGFPLFSIPPGPFVVQRLNTSISSTYMLAPLFIDVSITVGRWAEVTPSTYFTVYDFGWGKAYLFPGQVNLTMFLTNGTAIGFDTIGASVSSTPNCDASSLGSIGGVHEFPSWALDFACFVTGLIGDVKGFIASIFEQIWGFLQQLGQWIYSALLSFIDLLVKIVTGIIDAATNIVFALLAATPFILILFVAGKGLPDVKDDVARVRDRLGEIRGRRAK